MIISKGDLQVTFRKAVKSGDDTFAPVAASGAATAPNVDGRGQQGATSGDAPKEQEEGEFVTSPIVGTFYRSPSPDSPPFVEPGQRAEKGQTLCVIEAMKVMNELQSEFRCEILEVLVENGTMVEFGTPLYRVGP